MFESSPKVSLAEKGNFSSKCLFLLAKNRPKQGDGSSFDNALVNNRITFIMKFHKTVELSMTRKWWMPVLSSSRKKGFKFE